MSRGWTRTNLTVGEIVRVPMTLCIEPEKSIPRFVSSKYVSETDMTILIDFEFKPLFGKTENLHYRRCIDKASIWCGLIKMYDVHDNPIRVKRLSGLPVALGQETSEIQ